MTRKHLPVVQSDARYQETYAARKRLADEGRAHIEAAIAACGPGATAYAMRVIKDRTKALPDRVVYCCLRPEYTGWQPDGRFPGHDERVGPEHDPGFEVKGVHYRLFRFSFSFQALTDYKPQTPDQMKAAASRRRDAAIAKLEADRAAARAARAAMPQIALPGFDVSDEDES